MRRRRIQGVVRGFHSFTTSCFFVNLKMKAGKLRSQMFIWKEWHQKVFLNKNHLQWLQKFCNKRQVYVLFSACKTVFYVYWSVFATYSFSCVDVSRPRVDQTTEEDSCVRTLFTLVPQQLPEGIQPDSVSSQAIRASLLTGAPVDPTINALLSLSSEEKSNVSNIQGELSSSMAYLVQMTMLNNFNEYLYLWNNSRFNEARYMQHYSLLFTSLVGYWMSHVLKYFKFFIFAVSHFLIFVAHHHYKLFIHQYKFTNRSWWIQNIL